MRFDLKKYDYLRARFNSCLCKAALGTLESIAEDRSGDVKVTDEDQNRFIRRTYKKAMITAQRALSFNNNSKRDPVVERDVREYISRIRDAYGKLDDKFGDKLGYIDGKPDNIE